MTLSNKIINKKNIAYIDYKEYPSSGYILKTSWCIYIYFVGREKPLCLEFLDEKEFKETWERLEEELKCY